MSIRLKWFNQAQFVGIYCAAGHGDYAKAGLDVTIQPGGLDFPSTQTVADGSDQFGIASADQLLKANAQGKHLLALLVVFRQTPSCLTTFADQHLRTMRDLRDKTVGVQVGTITEALYRSMLAAAVQSGELARSDVGASEEHPQLSHEVPVKYDLGPFLRGEIAAWPGYTINEPLVITARSGRKVYNIVPSQYGLHVYADVLFTTADYASKHRDLVHRFVTATIAGWRFALAPEHEREALDFDLEYAKASPVDHEREMLHAVRGIMDAPNSPTFGSMQGADWHALAKLMVQRGLLSSESVADSAFSNAYLE